MITQFHKSNSNRVARSLLVAMMFAFVTVMGCSNDANEENRKAVEQNQALIEETQKEINQVQAQQTYTPPAPVPGTPGSCDKKVMDAATRRAGDSYANGDLSKALAYYNDALTACPGSAKANMNVARTYEAQGNREAALRFYRTAANANTSDPNSVQDARVALSRLGVR
jgi:tetratricopeptide (TPR) repeat protein